MLLFKSVVVESKDVKTLYFNVVWCKASKKKVKEKCF